MHYMMMFDRDYLGAWDLLGNDATVTIREVKAGKLKGSKGADAKKPIVYFEGKDKALALNKTNAKVIAKLYGPDTRAWAGKRVTLYPTTTEMAGDTVDCVRIRPQIPRGGQRKALPEANVAPPPEHDRPADDPDSYPDAGPPDDAPLHDGDAS